jgi:hypothetical protein
MPVTQAPLANDKSHKRGDSASHEPMQEFQGHRVREMRKSNTTIIDAMICGATPGDLL